MTTGIASRLAANQLAVASEGRDVTQCGPFRALLHPTVDLPWMNYAVATEPTATAADIDALIALFRTRGVPPRLEVLDPQFPAIGADLEACGFEIEARLPLMVVDAASFIDDGKSAIDVARLGPDDDLETFSTVQGIGFGDLGHDAAGWALRNRGSVARGSLWCAQACEGGKPVAVAGLSVVGDVGELVGVATLPEYRRRGFATAASRRLLQEFLAGDALVWLSAADEGATAAYRNLGFRTIGTQTNYVR